MSAERDLFGNEIPQPRAKHLKPEPKPKKAKEEKTKEERPKSPPKAHSPQAKVAPKPVTHPPKPSPQAPIVSTPERQIVEGLVSYAKTLEEWASVVAKFAAAAQVRADKIRKAATTQGAATLLDPEWSQRNADKLATAALNALNEAIQARANAQAAVAEYRRNQHERKG